MSSLLHENRELDMLVQRMDDRDLDDGVAWSFTRSEAKQFEAMEQLQEKGVTLVRWSDEDLAKIKAAWDEVVAEEVAKDPLFKEIYDNYSSFRARYKVWGDNGYLR